MTLLFLGLSIDYLFPFGEAVSDNLLQENDDGVASVQLTTFFPYFDHAESSLFVSIMPALSFIHSCLLYMQISNNGIFSFRQAFNNFSPQPFPNGVIMIAPFWADVDTRMFNEGLENEGLEIPPAGVLREDIGKVWFREDFSSELLKKAGEEIREAFIGLSTFTPTSLFIATWSNVGYYNVHIDKVYNNCNKLS